VAHLHEKRDSDGGQKKHRGCFGQHHQGEQEADRDGGGKGLADSRQAYCQVQRSERERGEDWFEDCEPAEAIEEGIGDHQRDGEKPGPARPMRTQKKVTQKEVGEEEGDGEAARGFGCDSGNEEQKPLKKRKHREGDGGIEVARHIPGPEQVRADGGVSVPAFVGVLCPVKDPWRVVGEIGAEVDCVQAGEEDDDRKPCPIAATFEYISQWFELRGNLLVEAIPGPAFRAIGQLVKPGSETPRGMTRV